MLPNKNDPLDEWDRFAQNVRSAKFTLTSDEVSEVVEILQAQNIEYAKYRACWKIAVFQTLPDIRLIDAAIKSLSNYSANEDSTGYENSADLQLQYLVKFDSLSDDILRRITQTPVGVLQLIIAEYFFSKANIINGLTALTSAIAYAKHDHSTIDAADMWLAEIASPEVHALLTERLWQAKATDAPKLIVSALEHALSQTVT